MVLSVAAIALTVVHGSARSLLPGVVSGLDTDLTPLIFGFYSGLAALACIPFSTRWASPILLHFDRRVGVASEAIWAAVGGLTLWGTLFGLMFGSVVMFVPSSRGEMSLLLVPLLVLAIAALMTLPMVMVRVAVALFRPGDGSRRLQRIAVGSAAGLVLPAIVGVTSGLSFQERTVLSSVIALFAPLVVGTSFAHASIDDEDVAKA